MTALQSQHAALARCTDLPLDTLFLLLALSAETRRVATQTMDVGPLAAARALQSFAIFETRQVLPTLIEQAIDRSVRSQLSFRYALIVSASASSGCTTIYSEDLNTGRVTDGVRIVNPFVYRTDGVA